MYAVSVSLKTVTARSGRVRLFEAPCLFVCLCVCVCVCVCVLRLSDNRLFLSNLSRPEAPRAHASIQCIQFILKKVSDTI